MRAERLSLALAQGAWALPVAGTVAVLGPVEPEDLAPLPRLRLRLSQPLRPLHDRLAAAGFDVRPGPPEAGHAAALVALPRSREAARALLAQAVAGVAPGAPVAVDGQKTDGADALLRELRGHVALSEAFAKAHGKLAWFAAAGLPESWTDAPRRVAGGFVTRAGVFSAEGPDAGSALLAAALPASLPGRGVDLGAGWGYLAAAALARDGVASLDLVEADAVALDCARANVTDARAAFHWADATRFRPAAPADWVLCNPPFHAGRSPDPALGLAFIAAAAGMLAPRGTLWLVANRHLPYAAMLSARFREAAEIGGDSRYRLVRATGPRGATPSAKGHP